MKRFWLWFHSLSRFRQIGISILIVHAGVLLIMVANHKTVKPKKPIAIRTAWIAPPQKAESSLRQTTPKIPAAQKKKTKTPPSSLPQKKTAALKKKAISKRENASESELLLQIVEGLAAITDTPKASNPLFTPPLPPSIEMQAPLTPLSIDNPKYGEKVSTILQNCLILPELGEVVAKIEIGPSGKVIGCEILETRSRKNAEFLKKRLQELAFPCFNEFGLTDAYLNFTITFRNVENS